ncbi:MAG: hypothetical protein R3D88_07110 [Alphaproteobacteria bacterium]
MNQKISLLSSIAIASVLISIHSVKMSRAQEKTVDTLSPVSEWSVQKMAANTDNGYCALSREYNGGMVLTLGQNVMAEYSLAVDYKNDKLNMDKPYKITLQPGPGQIRAYEMMPASQQAMVIRLGYDDSFMKSLEGSGLLKYQMDGKNNYFQISDFKEAQKKLTNCMQDLKGGTQTEVASEFSAEKIENAPPIKESPVTVKKEEIASSPEPVNTSPAEPEKIANEVVAEKPQESIEIAKVGAKEIKTATPSSESTNVAQEKTAAEKVAQEKMAQEKATAEAKLAQEKLEAQKLAAEKAATEKVAQEKLAAEKAAAEKVAQEKVAQEKAAAEAKLAQEKLAAQQLATQKSLEQKDKIVSESNMTPPPELAPQPNVQASNERVDTQTIAELKETKEKLAALEQENRQLYLEARKAQGAVDSAIVETGNQALKKIQEYERKLEAAQADNLALSKEIEDMRRLQEDGRLEAVSGDETLEQATKRYNEAQREISRLGLLLEQQRNAHNQEKQELEQMLFDPAVADEQQRERLAQLEEQLKIAQEKAQESHDPLKLKQAEQEAQTARQKLAELEKQRAEELAKQKQLEQELAAKEAAERAKQQEAEAAKQRLAELEKQRAEELAKQKQLEQELAAKEAAERAKQQEAEAAKQKLAELEKQRVEELAKQKQLEQELAAKEAAERAKQQEAEAAKQRLAELEKQRAEELAKQKQLEQELAAKEAAERAKQQEAEAAKQKLAELEKQKAVEEELKQKEKLLKEMESKLAQAEQKLTQVESINEKTVSQEPVKEKMVEVSSYEPSTNGEKISAPPSYEASRPARSSKEQEADRSIEQLRKKLETSESAVEVSEPQVSANTNTALASPASREEALGKVSQEPQEQPQQEVMKQAAIQQPVAPEGFDEGEIKDVLNRSGLSVQGAISTQGAGQYSWNAGGVTGQAQVVPQEKAGNLDQFIQNYIGKAQQSCQGDFASLPAENIVAGQGFEIACVGPNQGTSSSVIFTQKGDEMIAISVQTSAEDMDIAMDARDRIAENL